MRLGVGSWDPTLISSGEDPVDDEFDVAADENGRQLMPPLVGDQVRRQRHAGTHLGLSGSTRSPGVMVPGMEVVDRSSAGVGRPVE
jgi:hypothetical protein